ncbi:CidA/LrgA family protein [Microbulbifer guangxiensis]|uniref:CidA/LrgA family protein n=1 Tax=Microbulbifer guangxiensis TaxID=2904249 RepID=UPI001EFFE4FA|nr:CidA/LrgA family protein [Microbulbifer guangxiensis]
MYRPPAPVERVCQWLAGALILLLCERLGGALSQWLSLPIPGAVLGMLLLLFGLMAYGSVPRGLAEVSGLLLRSLALLFLPAAVGVYFLRDLSAADWLALLGATIVGTLLSFLLTALLLRNLLDKKPGRETGD